MTKTGTKTEVYYYDTETGFYYLQSRYYDPVLCRFLNADGYASTGSGFVGYNMYAYCNNNPVNYSDPTGRLSNPFKNIFNHFKTSVTMFFQGIFGGGKPQVYARDSLASESLAKSRNMQRKFDLHVQQFKDSLGQKAIYTGTISFYNKGNAYDFDMSYSVGAANYTMKITEITIVSGGPFVQKKTMTRYMAEITVTDVYDFTEWRTGLSMGNILNNMGNLMQQEGIMEPYKWELNCVMFTEWS